MNAVRPTLEKVAARAGVSRATVSRVVNGSPQVKPEIREVVMRAVEELGYVPNLAARSLVTQRADSIALVFPEPPARVFSDDPMFASIIRGVSQEMDLADKQLVLMLSGSPRGQERVERYTTSRHVDGVILASLHGADPLPAALARRGVPVVCGGRPIAGGGPPSVDMENVGGAEQAVRHLVASGRRRIATIAGPQDMIAGIDRLTGYRNVLRDSDRRSIVAVGDFTRDSGATAMRQLLRDDPALDAVFAASDMMALGALQVLRQSGRRVPDDVAVVGFDDVPAAAYAEPPLTTVRHPIHDMGRELARLVLSLASGEDVDTPVILPTELIVRESA
ncbi:LacI family DNA-binding transcriptional regulator [Planobispora siamensis]|uniref:LacI family transcriptional regulator n=1 Tax=Planobispora siamensis TaxID=936338 RepID=A0A8J3WIE8_9ACTN|nr:LacI family DNA-binding transcriptional regulator [Planobispora siamensis]GIH90410.1 LacI family transcriptional regulator [Planobispora siamensis]